MERYAGFSKWDKSFLPFHPLLKDVSGEEGKDLSESTLWIKTLAFLGFVLLLMLMKGCVHTC